MDLLDHFFFLICYNPERNEAILWQAKFQKTIRNMDVGYYCTHSTQLQVEVEGTVLFREEDMHFESYRIQTNAQDHISWQIQTPRRYWKSDASRSDMPLLYHLPTSKALFFSQENR